ncbi:hypothetical protein PT179_01300 [Erysipelothrix rhusiopathiae]|nr:hypothetical protein [Erysipelothrix rhusiopathiae]MDE8230148.1 hypothetical protein [Erysipelothrix rhusiopathiae]MDE8303559.1 hypothetical protein [Erysipelothrix rhusiopathiae]
MTRKPLAQILREYLLDEYSKTNVSQREFARNMGITQPTWRKLTNKDSMNVMSQSIDNVLNNADVTMAYLISTYGEFEE